MQSLQREIETGDHRNGWWDCGRRFYPQGSSSAKIYQCRVLRDVIPPIPPGPEGSNGNGLVRAQ